MRRGETVFEGQHGREVGHLAGMTAVEEGEGAGLSRERARLRGKEGGGQRGMILHRHRETRATQQ